MMTSLRTILLTSVLAFSTSMFTGCAVDPTDEDTDHLPADGELDDRAIGADTATDETPDVALPADDDGQADPKTGGSRRADTLGDAPGVTPEDDRWTRGRDLLEAHDTMTDEAVGVR